MTTEACLAYLESNKLPDGLMDDLKVHMAALEKKTGKGFGNAKNPLLVSVRSGSAMSMPGMMDTILNLGLNEVSLQGLIKQTSNPRFGYDAYRRFIQLFGKIALGIDDEHFDAKMTAVKRKYDARLDLDLSADNLKELAGEFLEIVKRHTGKPFPQDPHDQLWGAIGAVFGSWMNQRAITYRRLHEIPANWGTAVTVQAMVFGNMGDDCATGVCFTRDPSTGLNEFYGEYLPNAQGEDVVAGIRTPRPLSNSYAKPGELSMEATLPEAYAELNRVRETLERHYHDMQDIEFTIQRNKLYMLQTRNGKRTANASVRIAVEMAQAGLIDQREAIMRVNPQSLDQLLHPTLDPKAVRKRLAKGLPASPGAASGLVVFSADEAEMRAQKGEAVILVRIETSPEDIHGMHAARGILTTRGGMTSHAAVVARGMGRPCVAGAGGIHVDYGTKTLTAGGVSVRAGDTITLDGATGEIFAGFVPMIEPALSGDFAILMGWADEIRRLKVRANAETPLDAETARKFGAEGIGLSRTEHMFFDPERIGA
ncbi:MAG: pyruvate, phosphate dikinase, partial [Acidiphilium sp. 21-62-4]